jgi:hypothetical protein
VPELANKATLATSSAAPALARVEQFFTPVRV